MINKNTTIYYIRNALYAVAITLCTGAIFQTFLSECGLSSSEVGYYTSFVYILGFVISLALSPLPDRADSGRLIVNVSSVSTVIFSLSGFLLILLCRNEAPVYIFFIAGFIQTAAISVRNLYEHKIPYHIIDISKFGEIMSVDGVVTGVLILLPGVILSSVLKSTPYFSAMKFAFAIAGALALLSAVIGRYFVLSDISDKNMKKKQKFSYNLFAVPEFTKLIIPNFLRGLLTGAFSVSTVIALNKIGFDNASAAYISTAAAASQIAGSFLYTVLVRRFSPGLIGLVSGVITLSFPLCGIGGKGVFLAVYCIVAVGIMMINYAVPDIVYKTIPYKISGHYNIWRMALTTAGSALGAAVCGGLLTEVPLFPLLAVFSVCQLISSLMYYFYYKTKEAKAEQKPEVMSAG